MQCLSHPFLATLVGDVTVHPVALADADLLRQCKLQHTRRSGPGGQHRNKVETAVVLTHIATGIRAEASERRSQAANRKVAIFRLRLSLALGHRAPALPSGSASNLWKTRCSSGRIAINPQHADFPLLLAEIMDQLESTGADVKAVAKHFQCTTSQLVKFLKLEPRAFKWLNTQRVGCGLGALK